MTACTVELRKRHPGQMKVMAEATRFNVLMCGRRFGKTALGADIAVEAALSGEMVGWFAPTYKLLEEAWRELVAALIPIPGFEKSEQQHRIALPTGGTIECWSLDSEDPARGRKYHLAIIDEAGLVPRLTHIFQTAIRPTLADYAGGAWFLGTPKGVGDFSALWNQGQGQAHDPDWSSWRMPTASNPFIPVAEIAAMQASMPELVFRQEILGEPIDAGEHPIGLEHIRACLSPLSEVEPVVWGVDLARAVDFTVAVALDAGGHVSRIERWKAPWGVTRSRLKAILGDTVTYIDSTGVGDPIVEDLQRDGVRAQSCVFTARSKQQWVEGLIAGIQQRRVHFPEGWLQGELEALTAERTAVGTRYTAPTGLHDDGVMALSLAWHGYTSMGYPKAPKVEPWKEANRAQSLKVKDGKLVAPIKQPKTVEELADWAESRHGGGRSAPHRERLQRVGR